jgi:lysophospholipase-3
MSASDPAVFGGREVLVRDRSTGRDYTPRDTSALLRDAKLGFARALAERYIGFVKFRDAAHFPGVDVTAEKGSGLSTQVGVSLPSLALGQTTSTALTRSGDGNQEDITNDAVRAWRAMRCHRFRLIDNPGVEHVLLAWDPHVVARLLADAARAPKRCPA